MHYRRRSTYRYTMLVQSHPAQPIGWPSERLRLLVQGRWAPDTDVYETTASLEVVVELAGVEDDDFEVSLFEDAVVIEGRRQLPAPAEGVYHAAGIRQGLFQVEVPLPIAVDADRVQARYERGLLRITLPRRG